MTSRYWIRASRLRRFHLPVLVVAADHMLAERPWLRGLPQVRALWEMMFRCYARTLFDVEPSAIAWSEASERAAMIYLANTECDRAVEVARHRAHDAISIAARRVPGLARTSVAALDRSMTTIVMHVRSARRASRAAASPLIKGRQNGS